MTESFDTVVVGLGAMGAAAVAHLAARGRRVLGIEARFPAHELGSSHGDSRLFRMGYFEDPAYVPLLRRALDNWRALERDSGEALLTMTGVLHVGRPDGAILGGTRQACELHGLDFETLDARRMRERFPAFALADDEIGLLEPMGGFVEPERAVAACLKQAVRAGAALRLGEAVTAIEPDDSGVSVHTALGRCRAGTVVLATGPWIAQLVPALRGLARPIRQVVAWYEPRDAAATALGRMPVFLRDEGAAGSYFGFPALGSAGVKIGKHAHLRQPIDPDRPNPPVDAVDEALLDTFAAARLPALGARTASTTCRYTLLPGEDFLLDHVPGEGRVIAASPCSGHGFKFASVVGEILADLAGDGGTRLPIERFSFARLPGLAAA